MPPPDKPSPGAPSTRQILAMMTLAGLLILALETVPALFLLNYPFYVLFIFIHEIGHGLGYSIYWWVIIQRVGSSIWFDDLDGTRRTARVDNLPQVSMLSPLRNLREGSWAKYGGSSGWLV